jgi:hypothetical protein
MPCNGKLFEMSWIKRYALSCLIAVFILGARDGYKHPGERDFGSTLIMGAAWPVTIAVVLAYTAGELVRESKQG